MHSAHDARRAKITDEHRAEAARLREFWETRPQKLSQAEFGEQFGIGNQSAVAQFLHARTALSMKAASGFVRGLNAAGHKLRLADISPRLQAEVDTIVSEPAAAYDVDEFVDVSRVAVGFSAGTGREPHLEETIGSLKFRASFLRAIGVLPEAACIVDMPGHSMSPTIPDGSVILLNRRLREPRHMQIFGIRIGNELYMKRLIRAGDGWLARSDNEDREQFPDIHLHAADEDVQIIGRAMWMGARL